MVVGGSNGTPTPEEHQALCQRLAAAYVACPETASINALARENSVPSSTIRYYVRKLIRQTRSRVPVLLSHHLTAVSKGGRQVLLTAEKEKALVTRVVDAAKTSKWMTDAEMLAASAELTTNGKPISRRTMQRIKQRASQRFGVRLRNAVPVVMSSERAAVADSTIERFVRQFHAGMLNRTESIEMDGKQALDMKQFDQFDPRSDIINIDETIFELNDNARTPSMIALETQKKVHISYPDLSCKIGLITAVSIDGRVAPPYLMVQGSSEGWMTKRVIPALPEAVVDSGNTGYFDTEHWPKALRHIISHMRRAGTAKERCPLVLVVDNALTHFSGGAGTVLKEAGAMYLPLPAATSHALQPLDARNGPHQLLKREFRKRLASSGTSVGLERVLEAFGPAFRHAYDALVIIRSWRECGLSQYDTADAAVQHVVGEKHEPAASVSVAGSVAMLTAQAQQQNEAQSAAAAAVLKGKRVHSELIRGNGLLGMSGDVMIAEAERKRAELEAKAKAKHDRETTRAAKAQKARATARKKAKKVKKATRK
jgi:hypothetical protein